MLKRWTIGWAALILLGCDRTTVVAPVGSANTPEVRATRSATLPASDELRDRLDRVIETQRQRVMAADVNNAWQVVHGLLAYGSQLPLKVGDTVVPAMEWMLKGGSVAGFDFRPGPKGLIAVMDPGSKRGQGHEHQWLGYMAQNGVPQDAQLVVAGQTYTIHDLITQTQWEVRDGMEATWSLMGLSVYLPPSATWIARDGSHWSVERLVAMEASPSIPDLAQSACGGSHRLYAVAVALRRYLESGGAVEPNSGWARAQGLVETCIARARQFQQPDGAFSTEYFQRSGTSPDVGRRLNTTGHMFEFLAVALNDQELAAPWMTRAAVFLCDEFEKLDDMPIECGGLYHAAHGLRIYRQRRFGPSGDVIPIVPTGPGASSPASAPPVVKPVIDIGPPPPP